LSSGEQSLESSRRDAELRKNRRVLAEGPQGGATIQLLWNNNSIAGHEAEGAKIPGNQRVVLLAADGRSVGANDEFVPAIAIARGPAGKAQIVSHSLTRFIDECTAVVHGPDYADRRRTEWDQEAIAVFQHQIRQCRGAAGIGPQFQDNTSRGAKPFHFFHQ